MLVRYRYRIDPTSAQREALARAFGCARVVYNDALTERHRAYQAGERLSDTEVQRRVITQAKRTPERAAQGSPDRTPEVPDQARPPVDPAHP
jgi:putative transposase